MDYSTEVWVSVKGYEGIYEVSSMGRLRSLDRVLDYHYRNARKTSVILSLSINKAGYKFVRLTKNRTRKTFLVHRIVALNFLPIEEGRELVNHKNFNKIDNVVSNLEWVSPSENMVHKVTKGLSKTLHIDPTDDDLNFIKSLLSRGARESSLRRIFSRLS